MSELSCSWSMITVARRTGSSSSVARRGGELLLGEYWSEVVRIDRSIVAISPFGVDVPASSQGVGLRTELSGAEANHEVELREVFGPPSLSSGENLSSGEIFKVLVVGDDVDRGAGTF